MLVFFREINALLRYFVISIVEIMASKLTRHQTEWIMPFGIWCA